LVVEGKVVKANGTNLSGNEQPSIGPANNFLHTLFKQVDVYMNGKQVTPAMGTYAYRAYLETLLNYNVSAKESQLTSALYYKDTPGHMDDAGSLPSEKTITIAGANQKIMVPGSGNQGFAKRDQFILDGKLLTIDGPLFLDAFMSNRLLLDKVDIKLILNRSSNEFCLIDKNSNPINAKMKLTDVIIHLKFILVPDWSESIG
jgi:hypothetical protein